MADVGYVNEEVRKMYGIPLSQLTPEQRKILKEDGERRAKLIKERQKAVQKDNKKAFDDTEKFNRVLASCYTSAQKSILGDVAAAYAQVKKDGGEWSYANASKITRSRGLFEQINKELVKLGQKENTYFTDHFKDIYTDQFLRATYTLGQTMPLTGNLNMLNPRLIEQALNYPWSGAMFSDRLWVDKERLGRNLRIGLTQSMILGEDMDKIADRIGANMNTSKYNAMRIARTETKRVTYVSQAEAWKAQGIKQVKYMAANNGGDSRTCDYCRSLHGNKYTLGEEPSLPRHPNCRCWYVPVTPDTFGDNELNELTGSVRGSESYEKWKQEYQEALNPDGSYKPGWGRDWKDHGKVKYTAPDGKKYTLDEYRKMKTQAAAPEVVAPAMKVDVSAAEKKYNEALNQLDMDYKAKDMELATVKANYEALDKQYRSYSSVRRGLMSPEEAGFGDKLQFELKDQAISRQMKEAKREVEKKQAELRGLMQDREYLLKVGVDKVDSLDDWRAVRDCLQKSSTFDFDKYGDDLLEAIAGMDEKDIALQRIYFKNGTNADWKELMPKEVFKDGAVSDVRLIAKSSKVQYNEVKKLEKALSDDDIIDRLAGGDMTKGSCSSLGFAYIGNKNGFDVLDFRGGESQTTFSMNSNIKKVLDLPGVKGQIVKVKKEAADTAKLIQTLELNKEYYMAVGKHAAIIKNTENGVMYLELQSGWRNGWMSFDTYGSTVTTLQKRFGCRKTVEKFLGKVWERDVVLMEVDSFKGNTEFGKILGYINTAISKQKKGVAGSVK